LEIVIPAVGIDKPGSTIAKLIPSAKNQAINALCEAFKTIIDF
jgi:hypothetical protein